MNRKIKKDCLDFMVDHLISIKSDWSNYYKVYFRVNTDKNYIDFINSLIIICCKKARELGYDSLFYGNNPMFPMDGKLKDNHKKAAFKYIMTKIAPEISKGIDF